MQVRLSLRGPFPTGLFALAAHSQPLRSGRGLLVAALGLALPAHAAPMFLPLAPAGVYGEATAISADASTVVGYTDEAFRWTSADGLTLLGVLPGGDFSEARAVSADGSVIVGESHTTPTTIEAFRWTSDGGMQGLGHLGPTSIDSIAEGVSADGSVVVGWDFDGSQTEAFRWTAGDGMLGIGFLPDYSDSFAWGVSGDGSTIVGHSGLPFLWTGNDGMVALGSSSGDAFAISLDGSTVVGVIQDEAFRWTSESGIVTLGDPPNGENSSSALAVSADGSTIVGAFVDPNVGSQAFIWDATHGKRSLAEVLTGLGVDLTGWTLEVATGISADGKTIVGSGYLDSEGSGFSRPWLAVLVPEPGAGVLVVAGLLGLATRRRRGQGSTLPVSSSRRPRCVAS